MPGKSSFHLRFKVTLQTFGFVLFLPVVLPLLTHTIPKEFPFIFLVFNRFIRSIPSCLSDIEQYTITSRCSEPKSQYILKTLCLCLFNSFTCIRTRMAPELFHQPACLSIRALIPCTPALKHLPVSLAYSHPSGASDSFYLQFDTYSAVSLFLLFHPSIHPSRHRRSAGLRQTLHCLKPADPNLIYLCRQHSLLTAALESFVA